MKLKNAFEKIIHSVCLISVLFLSVFFVFLPVASFADGYSYFLLPNTGSDPSTIRSSGTFIFSTSNNFSFYYGASDIPVLICFVKDNSNLYTRFLFSNTSQTPFYSMRNDQNRATQYSISSYNSSYNVYVNSSLLSSSPNITVNSLIPCFSTTDEAFDYASSFYFPTPTPGPTPTPTPTPTPAPSTPTPDANAVAFFEKLGNDAQNGFGAILTSWTAANSHFYTSILFIALPVFLGIVGLIASFFFGGSDD